MSRPGATRPLPAFRISGRTRDAGSRLPVRRPIERRCRGGVRTLRGHHRGHLHPRRRRQDHRRPHLHQPAREGDGAVSRSTRRPPAPCRAWPSGTTLAPLAGRSTGSALLPATTTAGSRARPPGPSRSRWTAPAGWCAPTTPARPALPLPPAWPGGCAGAPDLLEDPPMLNPDCWLPAVLAERARQDTTWRGGPGDCSHPDTPDPQRLTVLTEEVGEVARAILDNQPDPAARRAGPGRRRLRRLAGRTPPPRHPRGRPLMVAADPAPHARQDAGQDTRAGRDWTDTAIEWASGSTAVAMFAYGVSLSYSVLHRIATAAGLPPWAADLWPLGFEAFMASAALNALAEQRTRVWQAVWWRRVPWYPWALTAATAGGSILLNWFHPAIPLDPPPGWLVSLVYGLPPLAAVFAWHLFLQRLAHRRQDHQQAKQDTTSPEGTGELDTKPADPLGTVRALLARETPASQVTASHVQEVTGLSRSRAYAVLRQLRAETPGPNGQPALSGLEDTRPPHGKE